MSASRKTFRTDLKAELAPLISSLQSQSDFFKYEPANYNKRSPIVFLRPAGSEHPRHTRVSDSDFFIEAHLLVLYADLDSGTYNEEDSTDLLDDLEQQLTEAVDTKRRVADKWQDLSILGRSDVNPEPVGGELYLHEVVTLHGQLY
jgi:hypothetical protein